MKSGKWRSRLYFDGKAKHLGMFETKELALEAFKNSYFNYYGKFPW